MQCTPEEQVSKHTPKIHKMPYIVIDGKIYPHNNYEKILSEVYTALTWPKITFDSGTIEGVVTVEVFLDSSGLLIDAQIIN
jgi:hypothetical protein